MEYPEEHRDAIDSTATILEGELLPSAPVKRERTQHQLERQHTVFMLSISGESVRAIAKKVDICPATVMSDLAEEQTLRSEELRERRDTEIARAIGFYEDMIKKALAKSVRADALLEQVSLGTKTTVSDRYLEVALKARERIDKILGLEAAVKIDVGVAGLLESLDADIPE